MVNINKKYFNEKLRMRAWGRFLKTVKKYEFPEVLASNMHKFLTTSEITMIEKRLLIPILIEQKLSYKTISEMLDVSPVTISFVKHGLTKKPAIHRKRTSINKPKSENQSFGPLMSPTEHMRRMRRKTSGF